MLLFTYSPMAKCVDFVKIVYTKCIYIVLYCVHTKCVNKVNSNYLPEASVQIFIYVDKKGQVEIFARCIENSTYLQFF